MINAGVFYKSVAKAPATSLPELSSHPFAGYFITELIGFPSKKAFILSSMICMRRSRAAALAQAMCGVVRYPTSTAYATNCNPFFGGCSNGNI